MKREEALNSFYCIEAGTDGVELVNEIYNSLDKQKCPNCRYANLDSSRYLTVHKCSMGVSAIDYDFGCIYWKPNDSASGALKIKGDNYDINKM